MYPVSPCSFHVSPSPLYTPLYKLLYIHLSHPYSPSSCLLSTPLNNIHIIQKAEFSWIFRNMLIIISPSPFQKWHVQVNQQGEREKERERDTHTHRDTERDRDTFCICQTFILTLNLCWLASSFFIHTCCPCHSANINSYLLHWLWKSVSFSKENWMESWKPYE